MFLDSLILYEAVAGNKTNTGGNTQSIDELRPQVDCMNVEQKRNPDLYLGLVLKSEHVNRTYFIAPKVLAIKKQADGSPICLHYVKNHLLLYIKPVQVHHLIPRCYKVFYKFRMCICGAIHLCNSPQFGIGAKHQISTCSRPFEFACFAVFSFI